MRAAALFPKSLVSQWQDGDLLSPSNLARISLCALLATMIGGAGVTFGSAEMNGEGSLFRQISYFLTFLIAFLSAQPLSRPRNLLSVPPLVAAVMAWCWLSLAWSAVPAVAIRRITLTTIILWTVAMSVRILGYRECLKIVRFFLTATLCANYIAVIFFSEFGIHQTFDMVDRGLVGDWKGIVQHKNYAGALSALAILFYVFDRYRGNIVFRSIFAGSAFVFLIYSHSKTSLGILVICLIIGTVARFYRPEFFKYVAIALTVTLVLALLSISPAMQSLTQLLQDPAAFTGRSQIWQMLLRYIGDHPLLGSGYGSFWNAGPESPVYDYATGWIRRIASGHNGYLDVAAQIGVGGAIVTVLAFVILPIYKLLTAPHFSAVDRAFFLSALLFCAGHNVTETSLLDRDAFVQVFLTIFVFMVYQPPWKRKRSELREESANL
jgi:exopolysaccharide production protein ExoQ